MAIADQLLEQMFSWLEQRERCAEKLRKLAKELELLRQKCNAAECVGSTYAVVGALSLIGAGMATFFTGGAAAPLLGVAGAVFSGTGVTISVASKIIEGFSSSDTMKDAQRIEEKSNEVAEEIQRLFERLRANSSSADPDEVDRHVMTEILRAMARRNGLEGQINTQTFFDNIPMRFTQSFSNSELTIGLAGILSFFTLKTVGNEFKHLLDKGANELIKQVAKTGFKNVLKGGAKVVGGAVGLAFELPEAIDNWKDLIEKNHVTKASQSLRDTADAILDTCRTLREQFDNIRRMFEEMAKSKRELTSQHVVPQQAAHCDMTPMQQTWQKSVLAVGLQPFTSWAQPPTDQAASTHGFQSLITPVYPVPKQLGVPEVLTSRHVIRQPEPQGDPTTMQQTQPNSVLAVRSRPIYAQAQTPPSQAAFTHGLQSLISPVYPVPKQLGVHGLLTSWHVVPQPEPQGDPTPMQHTLPNSVLAVRSRPIYAQAQTPSSQAAFTHGLQSLISPVYPVPKQLGVHGLLTSRHVVPQQEPQGDVIPMQQTQPKSNFAVSSKPVYAHAQTAPSQAASTHGLQSLITPVYPVPKQLGVHGLLTSRHVVPQQEPQGDLTPMQQTQQNSVLAVSSRPISAHAQTPPSQAAFTHGLQSLITPVYPVPKQLGVHGLLTSRHVVPQQAAQGDMTTMQKTQPKSVLAVGSRPISAQAQTAPSQAASTHGLQSLITPVHPVPKQLGVHGLLTSRHVVPQQEPQGDLTPMQKTQPKSVLPVSSRPISAQAQTPPSQAASTHGLQSLISPVYPVPKQLGVHGLLTSRHVVPQQEPQGDVIPMQQTQPKSDFAVGSKPIYAHAQTAPSQAASTHGLQSLITPVYPVTKQLGVHGLLTSRHVVPQQEPQGDLTPMQQTQPKSDFAVGSRPISVQAQTAPSQAASTHGLQSLITPVYPVPKQLGVHGLLTSRHVVPQQAAQGDMTTMQKTQPKSVLAVGSRPISAQAQTAPSQAASTHGLQSLITPVHPVPKQLGVHGLLTSRHVVPQQEPQGDLTPMQQTQPNSVLAVSSRPISAQAQTPPSQAASTHGLKSLITPVHPVPKQLGVHGLLTSRHVVPQQEPQGDLTPMQKTQPKSVLPVSSRPISAQAQTPPSQAASTHGLQSLITPVYPVPKQLGVHGLLTSRHVVPQQEPQGDLTSMQKTQPKSVLPVGSRPISVQAQTAPSQAASTHGLQSLITPVYPVPKQLGVHGLLTSRHVVPQQAAQGDMTTMQKTQPKSVLAVGSRPISAQAQTAPSQAASTHGLQSLITPVHPVPKQLGVHGLLTSRHVVPQQEPQGDLTPMQKTQPKSVLPVGSRPISVQAQTAPSQAASTHGLQSLITPVHPVPKQLGVHGLLTSRHVVPQQAAQGDMTTMQKTQPKSVLAVGFRPISVQAQTAPSQAASTHGLQSLVTPVHPVPKQLGVHGLLTSRHVVPQQEPQGDVIPMQQTQPKSDFAVGSKPVYAHAQTAPSQAASTHGLQSLITPVYPVTKQLGVHGLLTSRHVVPQQEPQGDLTPMQQTQPKSDFAVGSRPISVQAQTAPSQAASTHGLQSLITPVYPVPKQLGVHGLLTSRHVVPQQAAQGDMTTMQKTQPKSVLAVGSRPISAQAQTAPSQAASTHGLQSLITPVHPVPKQLGVHGLLTSRHVVPQQEPQGDLTPMQQTQPNSVLAVSSRPISAQAQTPPSQAASTHGLKSLITPVHPVPKQLGVHGLLTSRHVVPQQEPQGDLTPMQKTQPKSVLPVSSRPISAQAQTPPSQAASTHGLQSLITPVYPVPKQLGVHGLLTSRHVVPQQEPQGDLTPMQKTWPKSVLPVGSRPISVQAQTAPSQAASTHGLQSLITPVYPVPKQLGVHGLLTSRHVVPQQAAQGDMTTMQKTQPKSVLAVGFRPISAQAQTAPSQAASTHGLQSLITPVHPVPKQLGVHGLLTSRYVVPQQEPQGDLTPMQQTQPNSVLAVSSRPISAQAQTPPSQAASTHGLKSLITPVHPVPKQLGVHGLLTSRHVVPQQEPQGDLTPMQKTQPKSVLPVSSRPISAQAQTPPSQAASTHGLQSLITPVYPVPKQLGVHGLLTSRHVVPQQEPQGDLTPMQKTQPKSVLPVGSRPISVQAQTAPSQAASTHGLQSLITPVHPVPKQLGVHGLLTSRHVVPQQAAQGDMTTMQKTQPKSVLAVGFRPISVQAQTAPSQAASTHGLQSLVTPVHPVPKQLGVHGLLTSRHVVPQQEPQGDLTPMQKTQPKSVLPVSSRPISVQAQTAPSQAASTHGLQSLITPVHPVPKQLGVHGLLTSRHVVPQQAAQGDMTTMQKTQPKSVLAVGFRPISVQAQTAPSQAASTHGLQSLITPVHPVPKQLGVHGLLTSRHVVPQQEPQGDLTLMQKTQPKSVLPVGSRPISVQAQTAPSQAASTHGLQSLITPVHPVPKQLGVHGLLTSRHVVPQQEAVPRMASVWKEDKNVSREKNIQQGCKEKREPLNKHLFMSSNPAQDQSGNQQTSSPTDQRHQNEREGHQTEQTGRGQERESQQNKETGSGQQGGDDQGDKESDDEDEESDQEDEETDSEEESEEDESKKTGRKRRKRNRKKGTRSKQRGDSEEVVRQCQDSCIDQEQRTIQTPPGTIRVGLLNVRSMNNSRSRILELITQNNLDVFLTTETWLREDNADRVLREVSPQNYHYYYQVRVGQRGGGVANQFSQELQGENIPFDSLTTFECVVTVLHHDEWNQPVPVINVYHPPGYNRDQFRTFLDEFETLLAHFNNYNSLIVTGDFNIWVDQERRSFTDEFYHIWPMYNLEQHVREPTHEGGHTLDLVLTRNVEISGLVVRNDGISDHYTVDFKARPVSKDKREETKKEKDQR